MIECFKCGIGPLFNFEKEYAMKLDKRQVEQCRNPWSGKCRSTDIEVYIYYRGMRLPICHDCWGHIAEKDFEW